MLVLLCTISDMPITRTMRMRKFTIVYALFLTLTVFSDTDMALIGKSLFLTARYKPLLIPFVRMHIMRS